MPFETILGQERVAGWLRSALARGRVGHAYLLAGPDGTGKTLLAIEFAKALLCRSSHPPHGDECPECRSVATHNHPDFHLVQAAEGSRFILRDQARRLIRFLSRHPVQADRRVVVIRDAERLNEEASNALLKTIEEPPAYGVLLLTSSRPRNLLETIRSRCQEVRCAPLTAGQVSRLLRQHTGRDDGEIEFAARLSQGSVGRAIATMESGCLDFYLSVRDSLLAMPRTDPFALAGEILAWLRTRASHREAQREHLREILRLCACAYRDILVNQIGGDVALIHPDAAEALSDPARRLNTGRLLQLIEAFWTARRQTDRNVTMDLVLRHLMVRVAALQR